MTTQKQFQARDYRTDADYQVLDSKFRAATDLEYATLLAHVMIEDQLVALLAARLGTDTMPSLRGFEMIAGIALAGSHGARLREVAGWLNTARNEVGHKMHRKSFATNTEKFVRAVKGDAGKRMIWPRAENERINELRLATRFFMLEIAITTEYEEFVRQKGVAAFERKKARRAKQKAATSSVV